MRGFSGLKILDRYFLREILPPFGLGLLVYSFVLMANQILQYPELFIAQGVSFTDSTKLLLYLIPAILAFTDPDGRHHGDPGGPGPHVLGLGVRGLQEPGREPCPDGPAAVLLRRVRLGGDVGPDPVRDAAVQLSLAPNDRFRRPGQSPNPGQCRGNSTRRFPAWSLYLEDIERERGLEKRVHRLQRRPATNPGSSWPIAAG